MQKKTPSLVDGVIFDFKISCISGIYLLFVITLFMMGPFRAAHGWVAIHYLKKWVDILHLKKIQKMFK